MYAPIGKCNSNPHAKVGKKRDQPLAQIEHISLLRFIDVNIPFNNKQIPHQIKLRTSTPLRNHLYTP